jgi:hypothetical protein
MRGWPLICNSNLILLDFARGKMVKSRSIFIPVTTSIVSPPGLDLKEFPFDFKWFYCDKGINRKLGIR